jgi:hypothetical protein
LFQENDYQTFKGHSIDRSRHLSTSFQGKNRKLFYVDFSPYLNYVFRVYRPPLEHHALNGNSSCIITTLDEPLKICLCSYLIFAKYHALYLSCRNKQIHRQELRISNHWAPMPPHPAATKAQAKRKATKDTKAQPK